MTRQYNINVQYEFAHSWILEAGYVGSSSINLLDQYHCRQRSVDRQPIQSHQRHHGEYRGQCGSPRADLGLYASGFEETAFDGISNYNSLQVTLRKQFTHGFLMQASYTFSKDLSDIAGQF